MGSKKRTPEVVLLNLDMVLAGDWVFMGLLLRSMEVFWGRTTFRPLPRRTWEVDMARLRLPTLESLRW